MERGSERVLEVVGFEVYDGSVYWMITISVREPEGTLFNTK
jgi:hypothetical protein